MRPFGLRRHATKSVTVISEGSVINHSPASRKVCMNQTEPLWFLSTTQMRLDEAGYAPQGLCALGGHDRLHRALREVVVAVSALSHTHEMCGLILQSHARMR